MNSLALFGDAFPGPVPLTQFIDAAGGTAGRCAVMTAPASAAAGQRYVDSLRARGVTDLSLVLLDAASANDSAAAAAIGRATGIVFTSNLSEQFPSYVDSTTRVGSALRGKLTSGVAAAFASQDAKLAGATMVLRTELEELAAYRGKLVPAAGLRGLRNLVVMPLIFQSDVYDWNRVAGLPWAIARTDGKTAIFLDEGSSATIDRDGVVRSEGLTPAVVVDARNATYVGYSTFRHSGSVGPRQATALVGATTHVLARDYRFNALTGAIITGTAGADHPLPSGFRLAPAYPNPFNPATTIGFAVPHAAHTILTVYDALGRNVATLVDGMLEAGEHSRRFEGSGLASGVYLVLLRQGSLVSSQKLVLIR